MNDYIHVYNDNNNDNNTSVEYGSTKYLVSEGYVRGKQSGRLGNIGKIIIKYKKTRKKILLHYAKWSIVI